MSGNDSQPFVSDLRLPNESDERLVAALPHAAAPAAAVLLMTPVDGGGYQALIRAYISNGLRKHLAEGEAQWAKDTTVEEFSQRLIAYGVPEQAIQEAVAEMRAAR